jgi:hypothetical protein
MKNWKHRNAVMDRAAISPHRYVLPVNRYERHALRRMAKRGEARLVCSFPVIWEIFAPKRSDDAGQA